MRSCGIWLFGSLSRPKLNRLVNQHWYDKLEVPEEGFPSVTLTFGDAPGNRCNIPYERDPNLCGPRLEFGLKFERQEPGPCRDERRDLPQQTTKRAFEVEEEAPKSRLKKS